MSLVGSIHNWFEFPHRLIAVRDALYTVDLEQPDGLTAVDNDRYDAVVCSHVLEHLGDPYSAVATLAPKVNSGGVIYVEVPSPRSDKLPRAKEGWCGIKGCLNFHDDATHQTMGDLTRVNEVLSECGLDVGPVRRRLLWRRVLRSARIRIGRNRPARLYSGQCGLQ